MVRGMGSRLKLVGALGFIAFSVFVILKKEIQVQGGNDLLQKAGGYADFFRTITVPIGEQESGYEAGYRLTALYKMEKSRSVLKSGFSDTLFWYSRGPVNIGGRTRCIIVDPDDPEMKTWYAGTAGGGIWKTEDAGESWSDLTPELPNLSTIVLSMAESNHDVIYAGTGEGFGGVGMITGDGIFRSDDRGTTWNRIESTKHEIFYFINDILVSPDDENVLLTATNRGIYRTVDAGAEWDTVYKAGYAVQDLTRNPLKSTTVYAAVNSRGIIRSYDGGLTWEEISEGLGDVRRLSVAVSPADTAYLFASAELEDGNMGIYISTDGGNLWVRNGEDDLFFNFHGAQGWYNNAIAADPFIREKVFVGGVYVGALTFSEDVSQSEPEVLSADTVNTAHFLDFINFGGAFLGGGLSTGLDEGADVALEDFVSVELRFGPGLSQKAHRFQVPEGEGPGVLPENYTYFDYVDVPFEVWDVTNNRQLMVSIRDQERDGAFNLIERDPDDPIPGREYIFVHAIEYDPTSPDVNVAKAGGHYNKMIYFFWPTLASQGAWAPEGLPESMISIVYGSYTVQLAETEIIASNAKNTNLHVDHHHLEIMPGSSVTDQYTILSANDGGVAVSYDTGNSWKQLTNGFYTTQFYGVAKKPGAEVFIGGMQDNGTWRSPNNKVATEKVFYTYMLGGDGFELLWHPTRASEIIGSVYNNRFYKSSNGGGAWEPVTNGLGESGPFISKLSHSRSRPDTIYTVDAEGVYRHGSFANTRYPWQFFPVGEGFDYYGTATSAIDVEVSEADPSVVWTGQAMFQNPLMNIFVSNDFGETFDPVEQYTDVELGFISAIETHPTDPNTAFLLFSYKGKPKILRTEDKGNSWNDISGFGTDSVSSNGFPDVVVLSLLVMPHDPDVIWAGTEIGIVESVDNGTTWHLLDSDFPNVSVYQMFYQDNMIVLATHGRGIWTAGEELVIEEEEEDTIDVQTAIASSFNTNIYPNPADTELSIVISGGTPGVVHVKIYNLSGGLVQQVDYELNSTIQEVFRMNISGRNPGNYLLEICNGTDVHTAHVVIL